MPHIVFDKNNDLVTPSYYEGVTFDFIASSKAEEKIGVVHKDRKFLLTKKIKGDRYIIKGDKITRVSPVKILKEAIDAYAKTTSASVFFTNIDNKDNKAKPEEKYLKEIEYFVNDFNSDKEIWVEIGFGSGRHLLHQAKLNPDIQFIGLEIHTPSIEQMLKHVKLECITNILAVNYDARLFLEFLSSNSVGKIFVHFPVPWDKKPHRRVYSKEFVDEALRVLKVGGSLELRTDSRKYFDFCMELLTALPKGHIGIDINKELKISSKYEDRWKKQGKNIYDVILSCENEDKEKDLDFDFSFGFAIDIEGFKKSMKKKPIVKEGFLLHFEDVYDIDENSCLIKLTLGSFNRPLSKYVLVEQNIPSYYQGEPIPTADNIKAHNLLKEILQND